MAGRGHGARRRGQRGQRVVAGAATTYVPKVRVGRAAERVMLGGAEGLEVSRCCLGTMTWGQQNTEAEAHQQLSHALECGVNWLDAAEMYPVPGKRETQGRTEAYIGSWLASGDVRREDVLIASKVAGPSPGMAYLRDEERPTRVDAANIAEAVEKSLRRLRTDHLDLYQIHWPDRYVPLWGTDTYDPAQEREEESIQAQLEALDKLVREGKVRHIGVSNETSFGVNEFANVAARHGLPKIVSIQNVYNLLCRVRYETDLAETCRRKDVGLLAYSPLAGGILTGKYRRGPVAGARLDLFEGYMSRYKQSRASEAVEEYAAIAERHGLSLTELALGWCATRWNVASTIIGATTMEQLDANLAAFDTELPEEAVADIEQVFRVYRDPAQAP